MFNVTLNNIISFIFIVAFILYCYFLNIDITENTYHETEEWLWISLFLLILMTGVIYSLLRSFFKKERA